MYGCFHTSIYSTTRISLWNRCTDAAPLAAGGKAREAFSDLYNTEHVMRELDSLEALIVAAQV